MKHFSKMTTNKLKEYYKIYDWFRDTNIEQKEQKQCHTE